MSKAFVRENAAEDDEALSPALAIPSGAKNYITPAGYNRIKTELLHLLDVERPEVTRTVAWAASNGDRSENADYIYGKKRLREIDRRIRFLTKRLDSAEVVDNSGRETDQIFFGAEVTVLDQRGVEETVTIVGVDEVNPQKKYISWISPLASVLLRRRLGECLRFMSPGGLRELEIVDLRYPENYLD